MAVGRSAGLEKRGEPRGAHAACGTEEIRGVCEQGPLSAQQKYPRPSRTRGGSRSPDPGIRNAGLTEEGPRGDVRRANGPSSDGPAFAGGKRAGRGPFPPCGRRGKLGYPNSREPRSHVAYEVTCALCGRGRRHMSTSGP